MIRPDLSGGDKIRYEWRWEDEDTGSVVYHDRHGMDRRSNTGGGEDQMEEIKNEYYTVMTVHAAQIYHEALGLNFILADGQVKEVEKDGQDMEELHRAVFKNAPK